MRVSSQKISFLKLRYALYSVCIVLLFGIRLLFLMGRDPAWRKHVKERFAYYSGSAGMDTSPIWIHCASVGEARAVIPLIRQLRQAYPLRGLIASCITPTGRAVLETESGLHCVYLPLDTMGGAKRFLKFYRPSIALFVETEIWSQIFRVCQMQSCPIIIINARLSPRSAIFYRYLVRWLPELPDSITEVLAQDKTSADRFQKIFSLNNIRPLSIHILGNLKYDYSPSTELATLGKKWRSQIKNRSIFLAVSTREGEEIILLRSLRPLIKAGCLLLIVPRHPERFNTVAQIIADEKYSYARRSKGEFPDQNTEIWLGDTMGELAIWYSYADACFIGGSLVPLGGQNLIEACAEACPVLVGPHHWNFHEAVKEAVAIGAAQIIQDEHHLLEVAENLIAHPETRQKMRTAGQTWVNTHHGATERTLTYLKNYLSAPPVCSNI